MSKNLASSLAELTPKQRIYVESRLSGMTQVASAAAAGYAHPKAHAHDLENNENVQRAMMAAMNDLAEEVGFTRKEAHDMLMSAYMNAATSGEQIQAVKEMINLHGIAAPKVVEHEHKHSGTLNLEQLETRELIKLAGMEGDMVLEGEFEDVTDDGNDQKLLPEV